MKTKAFVPLACVLMGDVLLHGSGIAEDGQRVPLSPHVLLRRSARGWKPDTYVHAPMRGKFSAVKLDSYHITVREGGAVHTLLSAGQARDALAQPSLAAQVANYFVVVRPGDAGNPSAADITIGLGLGRLFKPLLRASFDTGQVNSTPLHTLLATGTWRLELQALSGQIPVWAVRRQLFVFGMEDSPLLARVRRRGLNKHDRLVLGAVNGSGYLRYNGAEERFPAAATSGFAFMRDSFIGLILAWQRRGKDAAPVAGPATP